jgi:hypothetical protein
VSMLEATPCGRRAAGPGVLVAGLLLAIILINPFWEMLPDDDGWAYARSVQHLLATGEYQLDAWAAANMPVQIYLAAGLSKLVGYSLGLLRFTTLALLVAGLGSLYALLREIFSTKTVASVLTLGLLASPLVLMLAFSFMSDIQFLGWLLLSLWLYVRAMRNKSAGGMFLGSLASASAIGTRQFGIAIIVGLVLSWLVSRRESRLPLRFILAGLLIPVLAAAAQFYVGLRAPGFTQAYRLIEQHHRLARPAPALLKDFFWRCSVILQYVGMSVFPALPLAMAPGQSVEKKRLGHQLIIPAILTALASAAIIAALSMTSFFSLTARPEALHNGVWEPLALYWLLPSYLWGMRYVMRILDFCGIVGAATLVWTGIRNLQRVRAFRELSSEMLFLTGTGVGLLALHLTYSQLNDTYIVAFIPFGLLVIAEKLRSDEPRRSTLALSAALSMILILITGLWLRGEYSSQFAAWKAAETLVDTGVEPKNIYIYGPRTWAWAWAEYHGAYEAWVAAGAPGFGTVPPGNPRIYDPLRDPFISWFRRRNERAEYRIADSRQAPPPGKWQLVASHSFRSIEFRKHFIWTWKRAPTP